MQLGLQPRRLVGCVNGLPVAFGRQESCRAAERHRAKPVRPRLSGVKHNDTDN